jgi:hypothetical protein
MHVLLTIYDTFNYEIIRTSYIGPYLNIHDWLIIVKIQIYDFKISKQKSTTRLTKYLRLNNEIHDTALIAYFD